MKRRTHIQTILRTMPPTPLEREKIRFKNRLLLLAFVLSCAFTFAVFRFL